MAEPVATTVPALSTTVPAVSVPRSPAALELEQLLDAEPPAASRRPWRWVAWIAVATLMTVVASTVAVWTAVRQSDLSAVAARESRLADSRQDALYAATVEQSLERAVRLTADPKLLGWHREAGRSLNEALDSVERDGGDRTTVERVRARHADYLRSIPIALAAGPGAAPANVTAVAAAEDVLDRLSTDAQASFVRAAMARETAADGGRTAALAAGLAVGVLVLLLTGTGIVALLWWRRLCAERRSGVLRSMQDELTGLPNRLVLQDRLEQALLVSAREDGCSALVVLDLDRFKEINDSLGHDHGDALLQQIAPRLRLELRESDTVARLGGDEFAIVLPRVSGLDSALLVAEKLRRALEEPFDVHGLSLAVEASVGVACSPAHGTDVRTLLQRADIAMYLAKDNQIGVSSYDSSVDGHSPARAALLGDLRRAIAEQELSLHFQPKASLLTGEVIGVEALVRWQHPDQGLLGPDHFVPLAERTGLVHPLTRFVLDASLAQCRAWYDAGIELPVAVNLSARTLLDRAFAQEVRRLLSYWQLPASLLTLEITESALMGDPERAAELLADLSAFGVRVAIDDFGTGYSSLSSLRTLPVHELKIDKSFVRDMLASPQDAAVVRAIVDLGHTLGMTVVAEGIEDAATGEELCRLGCDVGQGYFLGAPASARVLDVSGARRLSTSASAPPG